MWRSCTKPRIRPPPPKGKLAAAPGRRWAAARPRALIVTPKPWQKCLKNKEKRRARKGVALDW